MTTDETRARLTEVLGWASERDYAGYDYADGLSSRILQSIPVDHDYINLAFQETAKRTPVNVRPLLLVPKRRSFKGTGLFISSHLTAHTATSREEYLGEARTLGRWLLENRRTDPFGWGHNHRIQTLEGTVPRNTPSIVTVTYVVRALLRLRERGMSIPVNLAEEVRRLVTGPLNYERGNVGARIGYRAGSDAPYTVINANALGAALLTELADAYDEPSLLDLAEPLFAYVADRQSPCGGWRYADPADASHLSMDTHHNGFVLESFLRYREHTGDDRYAQVIRDSLAFHRETLFLPNGAPNWDEIRSYPRDIHAAAQGIITFARAGDQRFARQVLDWTDANLYRGDGRYGYRRGPLVTRRFTLMRWSQAWMARAIATLIERADGDSRRIPNRLGRIP